MPLYCPALRLLGSAVTVTVPAGVVPDGGLTVNHDGESDDRLNEAPVPSDADNDITCDSGVVSPSSAVKLNVDVLN